MTIKELRAEKKLSQVKFAESVGVSSSLIGAIEQGSKKVSANLSAKVKEVYGVDLGEAKEVKNAVKAEEKAATKKTVKKAAKKAPAKKAVEKTTVKASTEKVLNTPATVFIQSPIGGEITANEILAKIGEAVDKVYVRVDQNKAYWVKGDETGSIDLW